MLRDARPAPDRVWLVLFLDRAPSGQVNPTSLMLRMRAAYEQQAAASGSRREDFRQIEIYLFARDQSFRRQLRRIALSYPSR